MAIGVSENTFDLQIVSAEGVIFSGPAHALAISGADGELGIRPGHSPLISKIKPGVASFVADLKQPEEVLYVSGGLVEVQPEVVTVMADTVLHGEEIDKARAESARQMALENINRHDGDINFAQAQLELAKALAQLRVVELTSQRRR
ncbi:F0F1 ATP synthase subunit epsilon [Vibrio marisflavi]|uniref:ATP synthase epsilon chain n=1 Tax=Vibrio marisflavi CECT 7928 TaxID=634439 RepID=A0ABN8E407_9VIBR|nr:F0F1 ATP synthase subunit epsilon [Vibrio marisflavi]CAH0539201.1 ATP synthase epsilon chain [Vibrio marisflavi CECT 7928]